MLLATLILLRKASCAAPTVFGQSFNKVHVDFYSRGTPRLPIVLFTVINKQRKTEATAQTIKLVQTLNGRK